MRRDSDEEGDPEEARKGALADLMAKRSGTAGKATRRAASADPRTRQRSSDSEADTDGGSLGGVKDSKRRVRTGSNALSRRSWTKTIHPVDCLHENVVSSPIKLCAMEGGVGGLGGARCVLCLTATAVGPL